VEERYLKQAENIVWNIYDSKRSGVMVTISWKTFKALFNEVKAW
jgi:hypothetical protein